MANSFKDSFLAYCDASKKGSTTATDKTLKKMCTDAKLCNKKLDQNRVDIEWRKCIGNSKKEMTFPEFINFIDNYLAKCYAEAHGTDSAHAAEEIKMKIASASPHSSQANKTAGSTADEVTKRLTNVEGYTGAHKERFDAETGKGKGIEGREYVPDKKAQEGYVGGYKNMDTFDKKN